MCLSFYITPKGVQILCLSSFLQSCQPYGFNVIVLPVNPYCGKEYVNLRLKILKYTHYSKTLLYFINTKYTASIKQTQAAKWFQCSPPVLKTNVEKPTKIINVMTSWITFSCIKVKEPPFPINPILFAGTWNEYSARAITHEKRITPKSGQLLINPICWSFKCPYQAKVINILERIKSDMV